MRYFFDIPVYRLPLDKYVAGQEAYIHSRMYSNDDVRELFKQNRGLEAKEHDRLFKLYGGPWQFNQIIGYIRLQFDGTQILGEWWKVDAKRVTRTGRKVFVMVDWKVVDEEEIPKGSTSTQIYDLILLYLERAQHEKLKGYYIDTSVLERIGPHVNWEAASKALACFSTTEADQAKKPKG